MDFSSPKSDPNRDDSPPLRFTLRAVLLLMAVIAVILASVKADLVLELLVACSAISGVVGLVRFAIGRSCGWYFVPPVLALFGSLLVPATTNRHRHSPQTHCLNNLKQISLALLMYEQHNGSFPPPYLADAQGKPMHSWRVLLLPYLEQNALYKRYRFDEPWDGPNNRKLHGEIVQMYQCPAEFLPAAPPNPTTCSYLAITGPGMLWGQKGPGSGALHRMMLVEVCNSGIHWMEPRDLHLGQMSPTVNGKHGQGPSSRHPGGAGCAASDGAVGFLLNDMTPMEVEQLVRPPAPDATPVP